MSNQPSKTVSQVLDLVSHLGGPSSTEDDLKWALDIPAGKQLLEWLASQLPDPTLTDGVAGPNHHAGSTHDVSGLIQTAVVPMSLHGEEVDILDVLNVQVEDSRVAAAQESKGVSTPAVYELPYQLRSRTKMLESETALLERQTARLKHRLNATKTAEKDMKHTIHALRKQTQDLDESIQEQQQRLTDLSAEADTKMAQHISLAIGALQDPIPKPASKDGDVFDVYRADLASLSSSRAMAASTVKQLYLKLDERYASLPSASELQRDAAIVDAKLGELAKDKSGFQDLLQVAYAEELDKMAKQLEAAPVGPDTIASIIRSSTGVSESKEAAPSLKVDIKGELERAGWMDRLVLLRAQERGLDTVIDYMRDRLIPGLEQTYDDLYVRSLAAVETEVIVSALIEELEDINNAVENAKNSNCNRIPEDPEDLLEAEIIELLKGFPMTHGNASVLLNRNDVEGEVSALSTRLAASREADEKWASQLRDRVRILSSSTAPLLSATYANSPVNTSPPFAPSRDQVLLQTNTRGKAEELIDAAGRLQKEAELTSRDKRKLGSFVEKWVQSRK